MRRLLFFGAVLVGLGCGRVCVRPQPVAGADGGAAPCVQATDCPRPSDVLVCGDTEDQQRDCVACVNHACVRSFAEACP